MSKQKNSLVDTVEVDTATVDIEAIKQITNKVFNNGTLPATLPTGEVRPKSKGATPAKFRPMIELPEEDYQKLKHICTNVHEDVSKMLYLVVKTWLDSCEVKI